MSPNAGIASDDGEKMLSYDVYHAWIVAFLAIVIPLGAVHAQDIPSLATEDLVSKLQDVSAEGIGTDQSAWASGFMAIKDEPKFNGGIIGSAEPVISPVMRELVRRGVESLPKLIDHLSDARPTKLTVDRGTAKWFGKEYDPRYRDPAKMSAGVVGRGADPGRSEEQSFDHYTVKVGDLCFVAVGQIVNRQLNAVRYQPSSCLVVNSPVETPALAAAVKADWSGLTPADHQSSLEEDALHPSGAGQSPEAVKRLMFYYPEAVSALAVRLLNLPLCDESLVIGFLEERLLKETDARQQDRLMAEFRKENGEANYGAMQLYLISFSNASEKGISKESAREKIVSGKILARVFPGVDSKHSPVSAGADFQTMLDLVDALATFPSQAIDQAVYDLLKRTAATPASDLSVDDRCELGHACALRLIKPGDRAAFERKFSGIMSDFPMDLQSDKMAAFSKRFQAYLDDMITKLAPD